MLSAVVCVLALALGIGTLVTVSERDSTAHHADLNAYAETVCHGLAAPAAAYRSMLGARSDPGRQRESLKDWYTAYFRTMSGTTRDTMSTLDRIGPVGDGVSATDDAIRDFLGTARIAAAEGGRGVAAMRPDDPSFDARIDQLTGGPIAPERWNAMLERVQQTPRLIGPMRSAPACAPALEDMQLVVHGRMLDLLFNGNNVSA